MAVEVDESLGERLRVVWVGVEHLVGVRSERPCDGEERKKDYE